MLPGAMRNALSKLDGLSGLKDLRPLGSIWGKKHLLLRRSVSPKSKVPGRWDQRWINDKRLGNGPKLQGDRWVLWFKGDAHQWGAVELLW